MTHWRFQTTLFITFIAFTSTAVVKWLPNSSFNLANSYKDGKLPCSKQTVVFPETMVGSINLESTINVNGFELPRYGELVMDGEINLGALDSDTQCTSSNAFYIDKSTTAWNQADVWSSDKFNEATPDSMKVPCYDDTVIFPAEGTFSVSLPNKKQKVAKLMIGQESYNTFDFAGRVVTQADEAQQFILNDELDVGVQIKPPECKKKFGCPCQENPLEIDCSTKFCPPPPCVAPIKPNGFCCSICGGYLSFNIDENFDMKSFKDRVEKTADKYGNSVTYHLGLIRNSNSYAVQLVAVDKGEYEGASAELIHYIEIASDNVYSDKVVGISGSPISKKWMGFKIFVSVFFIIIAVMGAIYLYYYRLPNSIASVRMPIIQRSGYLSRFNRRTDSVVSLTRRDSVISGNVRSSFNNPLYDSIRGRVLVEETAVEE